MKTKLPFYCLIVLVLFSTSCNKDDDNPSNTEKQLVIAGSEQLGNIMQAKIWNEKGEAVVVADKAVLLSIAISGNDLYAAGYISMPPDVNNQIQTRAVYWKNGNPVYLSDGTTSAQANDIAIDGNDIYISGYEYNINTTKVAKYWKNGVAVNLTSGLSNAEAKGICVYNNDIYVSGFESDNTNKNIVKYWKNGQSISLSTHSGYANAITVQGSDIYVVGQEYEHISGSLYPTAKYWKNGNPVNLSDGSQAASALNIYKSSTDLYIVGFDNNAAVLWKNNDAPVNLGSGMAIDVCVDNNNVYVAGIDHYKAAYWKNGQLVKLGNNTSLATGIGLKP